MSSKIVQEKIEELLAYVEKLKQSYKKASELAQKQAEEIERLQKENQTLKQELSTAHFGHLHDLPQKEKEALKGQLDDLLRDIKKNIELLK